MIKVFPVQNSVALSRLLELMPISDSCKSVVSKIQNQLTIDKMQIPLYLGNLGIYAQKI